MSASEERAWLEAARGTGDRAACEALVARYGPVVLGACRRRLGGDEPAAMDAFRATFQVLLRRGGSLGRRTDLGTWLHRAACRAARPPGWGRPSPALRGRRFDLEGVVDDAIDRLWFGRAAVVTRDLMGLPRGDAAARLGCSVRSLDRRLKFARRSIDARLRRAASRALRTGRATAAGLLSREALADVEVPASCREAVARDAARLAGDRRWDEQVSAEVSEMARTVAAALVFARLRKLAAATTSVGVLGAGASYAALQTAAAPSGPARPGPHVAPAPAAAPAAGGRAEALRAGLVESACESYREAAEAFRLDLGPLDAAVRASRILLDAELDGAAAPARRRSALAEHRARAAELLRQADSRPGGQSPSVVAEARTALAEARLWEARGGREAAALPAPSAAADGGSAAVLARLDEEVPMDFPRPTPLGDVLDYVRRAAGGPGPGGRPLALYVDPAGMKRAGAGPASLVTIAVEGVPLRQSLQLVLRQAGLTSYVEDGVLVVTSAEPGPRADAAPSPLDRERERAGRGELTLVEMKALAEKIRLLREIGAAAGEAGRP